MTKKLRRVRINREKWIRGGETGLGKLAQTALCDTNGQRCCLGFAMNQISRIPFSRLISEPCPEYVVTRKSFLTDKHGCNNLFTMDAIAINDYGNIPDHERESKLIKLFRKNGIILTFYGKTHDDLARSD